MKAIIYARVSTKEQAVKGYSLESQEKDCRDFALNNSFEVDKVFVERGESAKTQDRTELQNLLRYAFDNKKALSTLIIWKYDRLARNLVDQTELVKNFSTLGIRVLSVTENNDDNSVGRLMRNIIGSFAQYENDLKSERTISGMKQAIQKGRWCWKAPFGYKQSRDEQNKPLIVPSEDDECIQQLFRLAESGLYKQAQIVSKIRSQGFVKITEKNLPKILTNPLYAGLIKVSWFEEYVEAIHKPLVSQATFFKVQGILRGDVPTVAPRILNHPDFPLRNFVKCAQCGKPLTGAWSTGRHKVKYAYYRCQSKGCSLNARKKTLETKFYELLKSIHPKDETLNLFEEIVIDGWKARQLETMTVERRKDIALKALEEKKDRLNELMISGTIDEDIYREKIAQIKNEILVNKVELNESRTDLFDIESCVHYCKYFVSNIAELWLGVTDIDLKQRLQSVVFPHGIHFDGKVIGTPTMSFTFQYLQKDVVEKSRLVAPRGIEPLLPG